MDAKEMRKRSHEIETGLGLFKAQLYRDLASTIEHGSTEYEIHDTLRAVNEAYKCANNLIGALTRLKISNDKRKRFQ